MPVLFRNKNTGLVWEIADEEKIFDLEKDSNFEKLVQEELKVEVAEVPVVEQPTTKASKKA